MNDDLDIQVVESTPDPENEQMHLIAKMAASTLGNHYPEHLWAVGWAPGRTLVIKLMSMHDSRYGYTVDAAKAATVSELEHSIMIGGGELLERCGAPRGRWGGEFLHLQGAQ